MSKFYICNQKLIDEKIKDFVYLKTSDDGWSHFYKDINTNEEWVLTRYETEYHGGGCPILKKLPPPSVEELIEIALTSDEINDITGASIELNEREKYNNDSFRDILINKLLLIDTNCISAFDIERLKTIIYESELYDANNRREIVGKHYTEINKDAEFYKTISVKAKAVLIAIKQ